MAARTTGKPKQESPSRATGQTAAKKATTRKSPAKKASRAKTASKKSRAPQATDNAHDLLVEQNEALRTELDQANARIKQLEELNKNVVDRIDWVIDSLQTMLKR